MQNARRQRHRHIERQKVILAELERNGHDTGPVIVEWPEAKLIYFFL
jgi:hypothetical protein